MNLVESISSQVLSLLPLWEKVAIGGLWPPFFNRTPMPCIGYAKSVPDEGSASAGAKRVYRAEKDPSHLSMRSDLSHKGRGGPPMLFHFGPVSSGLNS